MEIASLNSVMCGAASPLNQEQRSALEEIVARYDPEDMSREDMVAMRGDLAEAGIQNSREAMAVLKDAGFLPRMDVQAEGGQTQQMTEQQKGQFWDLYKQFQTGKISEGEFKTLMVSHIGTGALINLSF